MTSKDKPTADSAVELDEAVLDSVQGGIERVTGGIEGFKATIQRPATPGAKPLLGSDLGAGETIE